VESNFEAGFAFVIRYEKYRADNPTDHGKLTIWGIASKWHPEEVKKMLALTEEEALQFAKGIYHKEYWLGTGCDKIASGLDLCVFDTAVLCGPNKALGFLGQTHDWKDYLFLRLEHQNGLDPYDDCFIEGWLDRAVQLWKVVRGLR
jgi:lysozyme family protein